MIARPLPAPILALLVVIACDRLAAEEAPANTRAVAPAAPAEAPPPPIDPDDPMAFVDDPADADVDPAKAARAKAIWDTGCAPCHGSHGDGKGPAAAGLETPPRDFHRRAWQQATADAHIKRVILEGGPAFGLGPEMAAHRELAADPALLDQLVAILRGLPHWRPTPPGVEVP